MVYLIGYLIGLPIGLFISRIINNYKLTKEEIKIQKEILEYAKKKYPKYFKEVEL